MADGIVHYIKIIFSIYILLTIIDNLVTNEKYTVYIKTFCGIALFLCIINPVLSILGSYDSEVYFENTGISFISDEVYQSIINAELERDEEIIELYYETVKADIKKLCETYGFVVQKTDIVLDNDFDGKATVNILMVEITIEDKSGLYGDYNLVMLKNNLANFYNIKPSNIFITVSGE